jgi:hypothetical protein
MDVFNVLTRFKSKGGEVFTPRQAAYDLADFTSCSFIIYMYKK